MFYSIFQYSSNSNRLHSFPTSNIIIIIGRLLNNQKCHDIKNHWVSFSNSVFIVFKFALFHVLCVCRINWLASTVISFIDDDGCEYQSIDADEDGPNQD